MPLRGEVAKRVSPFCSAKDASFAEGKAIVPVIESPFPTRPGLSRFLSVAGRARSPSAVGFHL